MRSPFTYTHKHWAYAAAVLAGVLIGAGAWAAGQIMSRPGLMLFSDPIKVVGALLLQRDGGMAGSISGAPRSGDVLVDGSVSLEAGATLHFCGAANGCGGGTGDGAWTEGGSLAHDGTLTLTGTKDQVLVKTLQADTLTLSPTTATRLQSPTAVSGSVNLTDKANPSTSQLVATAIQAGAIVPSGSTPLALGAGASIAAENINITAAAANAICTRTAGILQNGAGHVLQKADAYRGSAQTKFKWTGDVTVVNGDTNPSNQRLACGVDIAWPAAPQCEGILCDDKNLVVQVRVPYDRICADNGGADNRGKDGSYFWRNMKTNEDFTWYLIDGTGGVEDDNCGNPEGVANPPDQIHADYDFKVQANRNNCSVDVTVEALSRVGGNYDVGLLVKYRGKELFSEKVRDFGDQGGYTGSSALVWEATNWRNISDTSCSNIQIKASSSVCKSANANYLNDLNPTGYNEILPFALSDGVNGDCKVGDDDFYFHAKRMGCKISGYIKTNTFDLPPGTPATITLKARERKTNTGTFLSTSQGMSISAYRGGSSREGHGIGAVEKKLYDYYLGPGRFDEYCAL